MTTLTSHLGLIPSGNLKLRVTVVVGVQVDDESDERVQVGAGKYVVHKSSGSKEAKTPVGQAVPVGVKDLGQLTFAGDKVIHGPTIVKVSGLPESVVKRGGGIG